MKHWQRYWLYLMITFWTIHIVRDILQDTGVRVFLSTVLVKTHPLYPSFTYPLWRYFNPYLVAVVEIVCASICLRRNRFALLGYFTIALELLFLTVWLTYWFFL